MFGDNLLYVTEEDAISGGIKKFYFDGAEWKFIGLINSGIANDSGFRGLTGRLENGVVTLYGITSLNLNNSLVKITDNTPADNIVDRCSENIRVKVLARATATTGFRGIAFTPGTVVTLPVSLTSFGANVVNGKIKLTWSTSSEYNNSHFDVLHSIDGKDFKRISSLKGQNKADFHEYNFADENASGGTNYYLLKQVDINGQFKTYGPISANLVFKKNDFNILVKAGTLELKFYSDTAPEKGIVSVFSSNGQRIVSEKVNIIKGENQFIIPLSAPPGTYIVQINIERDSFVKKITKN